jgi:hypothetical protein
VADDDRDSSWAGLCGCRYDRGACELADRTLRGGVRAMTFGAVSPVEGRSDQHPDDKDHRKQDGFNTFHGYNWYRSMRP